MLVFRNKTCFVEKKRRTKEITFKNGFKSVCFQEHIPFRRLKPPPKLKMFGFQKTSCVSMLDMKNKKQKIMYILK
jgi:hypothetical protein